MVYDVIIVGGGPVGLFIGEKVASLGYDVLILEEHPDIGNPCHCAGLFSTHIIDITGRIGVLHPARRARIHAPGGDYLEIGDERIRGFVVDRVAFDRELARRAVRKGCTLTLRERVRKVFYPEVFTSRGSYRARIIVGADGINSVVRRSMGVKAPKIIGAVQSVARYPVENVDMVEIFLGNTVAPGFFAWIVPLFDDLVKIGLASYGNSWEYLKVLLKRLRVKILSINGGGIPIGGVERTYSEGTIIVGDAASQVKATSGGGVYPGLVSATCAVEVIRNSLEKGDFSASAMAMYEKCWEERIGKELKRAYSLHKIYRKIRDREFDALIREMKDEEILQVINEFGDIDYPSRVVFKVLKKKPTLLRYISIPARPYRRQI